MPWVGAGKSTTVLPCSIWRLKLLKFWHLCVLQGTDLSLECPWEERVWLLHTRKGTPTLPIPRDRAKDHGGTLSFFPSPSSSHCLAQPPAASPASPILHLRPGARKTRVFSCTFTTRLLPTRKLLLLVRLTPSQNSDLRLPGVQQQQGLSGFLNGCKGERVGIPMVPNLGGSQTLLGHWEPRQSAGFLLWSQMSPVGPYTLIQA